MKDQNSATEEQLDFLNETMNIGAGNAAVALQSILGTPVTVCIPAVRKVYPPDLIGETFRPHIPASCVRTRMIGDVSGDMFFIVPGENTKTLVRHAISTVRAPLLFLDEIESSILAEVGNILAGAYLTAIQRFCGLKISHIVPALSTDMLQSVLDECISSLSTQVQLMIVVENIFIIDSEQIRTSLLIIPKQESVQVLMDSMGKARECMMQAG